MLRRTAKRKDTPQQHHHHNHTFSSPPLRTKPLPIGAPSPAAQTPPTASPQGSIAASYSPGHRPYAAHPRVSESSTIASPFPSSASIDSMPPLPGPSTGPGHGHGHAQPHPQGQHMGRSQSAFNFLLSKARAPFSSASNPSGMATSTSLSSLPNHLEDAASTDSLAGAHRDGTSFTYHRPWPTPTERPSLHEAKPPPLTRPSMSDEPSVSSPTKRGFFSGVGRERKVSNASAGKGGPIKGSFANSPLGKATRSEGLQSGSPQAYGLFSKSQSDLHSRPEFPSPGTVPVELPRVSSPAPMAPEDRAFLRSPSPNVGYSRSVDDLSQMNGPYPAFPGHSPQQFGGRIKPTGEHGFVTGQWRPSDLGTLPAREASRTASSTHARSESLMSRAQTSPSPSNQQASGLQQDTDWPQVPQIPAQHLHAPAQSSSRHQRKTSKAQSGNSREPTQGRSQGHMSIASSLGLGGMASATACTVVDKVHSFSSNLRVPASAGAPSSSPSPGASGSQKRGHSSTTSTSDARPLLAPGVVYEGFLNRNANISVSLSQLTENDSGKGKEREKDVTKGWKAYKVVLKDGKLHFYKPPSNVSDEVKALFPTTVVRGPGASPAASGGRAAAVQYAQELGIDAEALKRGGLGTNALLLATASSANAPTARTPTHSNAGGHQGMPPPLPPKRSGDLPLTSPTKSPGQDAFLSTGQSAARPQWEGAGKHPELLLVDSPHPPSSWAARLRSGSPAAIAHELVFGTQISVDGSKTTTQEDYQRGSDEFFRVVALALLSLDIPLAAFAAELRKWTRTALAVSIGDQVGQEVVNEAESAELSSFQSLVRKRIGRFLEAVCANHGDREGIQAAMEELQGLVRETFADSEEASLKLSQIYDAATPSALAITPTDWSADAMPQLDRARSELAEMATSGRLSGAVLLRLDPAEVAQQIQAFHADRFRALVVPYLRSSDMVKQCARPSLANLFSFDSARPHFLTRLVLDHLLPGGEASPKQSGLSGPSPRHRAALLRHWIAIASYLYSYADLAGWVAISAALCSRAVARLEQTWRFVADGDRHLVGQIWAPKLAQLGWTDGGQRTVLPLLTADGSSQAPVSASGSRIAAIAYFGDVRVELERRWPPLTESRGPTQQVPVADWVGVYGRVDGLVQLWQTQCGGESRALDASSITPAQNAIEEYQIALQAMSAARTDVDVSFYLLHSLQAEPKSLGNLDLRFRSPLPPSMSANAVMPLLFPETLPHLGLLDRDHVHKLASTGDRHAGQSHGPTGTITARSHERVKLSSSPLARSRTFPPGPNARSISGRPIAYAGVVEWSAGGAPDETLLPIGSELVLKAWQEPTSSLPSSPMTSKRFSQELSRRPLSQVSKRSSLPASNRSSYVDPVPLQVVVKAATVERLGRCLLALRSLHVQGEFD